MTIAALILYILGVVKFVVDAFPRPGNDDDIPPGRRPWAWRLFMAGFCLMWPLAIVWELIHIAIDDGRLKEIQYDRFGREMASLRLLERLIRGLLGNPAALLSPRPGPMEQLVAQLKDLDAVRAEAEEAE